MARDMNYDAAIDRASNVIPMRRASEKIQEQARTLPDKLLHFADIKPATEANDFIEGLLTEGGMSVIYGESNSGKTFFATDLAFHVACGWAWNGRDVRRGSVLYCSLEGSFGIRNRMAALARHHAVDPANVPLYVLPVTMELVTPDGHVTGIEACIKEINRMNPTLPVILVVIDTLSRALNGGNENGAEDMGALVGKSTLLQQDCKVHVAWIHHSGKDAARGARGHSLLRAATDTEIEITAEGPARTARVTKQRDLECTGEFSFSLKVVELGTNDRGKQVTSCVVDYGEGAALGREHAAGAASALRHLTGHNKRALEVLIDLCAASGQTGDPGLPPDAQSVPERWWRDRFFDRAAPGAEYDAKRKAFDRASSHLINNHIVGMSNKRVWVVACCGAAKDSDYDRT
jgi:hypothetical protein